MTTEQTSRAVIYARQSLGKTKSIADQLRLCTADAIDQGWTVVEKRDDTVSASRFGADHDRPGWAALQQDLRDNRADVVVVWEASRGDRKLTTWSAFLDLCRETGTRVRVVDADRTLDPTLSSDWSWLASEGVSAVVESERASRRTLRGIAEAARDGRPGQGTVPYGYRRRYCPDTGKLSGQEPDPVTAPVVREIVTRVADGEPLVAIARDLTGRGVPTPGGQPHWRRGQIVRPVRNVAYVGLRLHRGQTYPGTWEPLVAEDVFWRAQRVMSGRGRKGNGDAGRVANLLAGAARCAVCDGPMSGRSARGNAPRRYQCRDWGCVYIDAEPLEDLVLARILGRLARPDVFATLRRSGEHADKELLAARAEADRLRAELETWRESAARGETTPATMARVEAGLSERIEAADSRAERTGVDPALRGLLDSPESLPERWAKLPLASRREVVRLLVRVTVAAGVRGVRVPVEQRVSVEWKGAGTA